MRVLITLAYVGTGFSGYQSQKNKRTVQGELESALFMLYKCDVKTVASGRTDEGVHAYRQAVHFDLPRPLPRGNILRALNTFLPPEIRVLQVTEVADDFNARMSAKRKTYVYKFYISSAADPFMEGRALRLDPLSNFTAMQSTAKLFIGKHDFSAFHCIGSSAKTTVRTVYNSEFNINGNFAEFTITANGFLYKMVRLIVGTLIKVGENKLTADNIAARLALTEPSEKPCAPSCGLYLYNVEYDK